MKKAYSPVLCLLFLAAVIAGIWVLIPHKAEPRPAKEIIRDLIRSHAAGLGEEALLKELEQADEQAANKWQEILACWDASGNDMALNQNVLPDGLEDGDTLCLIVLGYQLNPDGTMREELIGRLKTALNCAEKYPNCYILCTGGGTAARNSAMTEADAMAGWLEEQGIQSDRIIVENKSLTTTQNAIFSFDILSEKYPEVSQIALVSSDYHIPWAVILFETRFILGESPLRVVSNAVYPTEQILNSISLVRYQMNGILEIAGLS